MHLLRLEGIRLEKGAFGRHVVCEIYIGPENKESLLDWLRKNGFTKIQKAWGRAIKKGELLIKTKHMNYSCDRVVAEIIPLFGNDATKDVKVRKKI